MDITTFSGEYEFLSNFYEVPVYYEYLYDSAEAAYQAQKCVKFDDLYAFTKYSPSQAKKMGKKLEVRPDWAEVKVPLMRDIVFAKFAQNPELAERLIATGDSNIIEENYWHDTFWGVDEKTGEGQNYLGKILMETRDKLKNPDVYVEGENIFFTRFTLPKMTTYKWTPTGAREQIKLEFEEKYELKHKHRNSGIDDCRYRVRDREFIDLSFRNGKRLKELCNHFGNGQELREYDDGQKFIYQYEDIPVFDSGDAIWDNINEFVMFRDSKGINLIRSQHGCEIPKISIYLRLKKPEPLIEKLLAIESKNNL